ncbi:MAG: hypothetical protein ACLSE8_05250 [Parasutterella sp.]
MVFLVLLNYSLPNGTVQTSDSGFIVREKNIPTAALTDLRTHRNQVFDFMRQKGDFFDGNSCYLTTEFNIKKVEHFLDKQKKNEKYDGRGQIIIERGQFFRTNLHGAVQGSTAF